MKFTKFTAGLLAVSLATAGISAAPARASDNDVALALGGLVTLFVIGKALENKNDDHDRPARVTVPRHHDRDDWRARNQGRAFEIPGECVLSTRGQYDRGSRVAMENCLKRERVSKAKLPQACETRVRTQRGRQDAYDVGCLQNFGYRITRPHRPNW
nr:hypothetical protein [uncultured Celeribacter sp.]